mgnify:CR=1 FL=1
MQIIKKGFYCMTLCLLYVTSWAMDSTGLTGLDTTIDSGQKVLKVAAKWGGIGILISAAILFGSGKAKGEALTWLFWLVLACGLIIAGFGWWTTTFTEGFALNF